MGDAGKWLRRRLFLGIDHRSVFGASVGKHLDPNGCQVAWNRFDAVHRVPFRPGGSLQPLLLMGQESLQAPRNQAGRVRIRSLDNIGWLRSLVDSGITYWGSYWRFNQCPESPGLSAPSLSSVREMQANGRCRICRRPDDEHHPVVSFLAGLTVASIIRAPVSHLPVPPPPATAGGAAPFRRPG